MRCSGRHRRASQPCTGARARGRRFDPEGEKRRPSRSRCGHGRIAAQMWGESRRRCGGSRGADVGRVAGVRRPLECDASRTAPEVLVGRVVPRPDQVVAVACSRPPLRFAAARRSRAKHGPGDLHGRQLACAPAPTLTAKLVIGATLRIRSSTFPTGSPNTGRRRRGRLEIGLNGCEGYEHAPWVGRRTTAEAGTRRDVVDLRKVGAALMRADPVACSESPSGTSPKVRQAPKRQTHEAPRAGIGRGPSSCTAAASAPLHESIAQG